MNKLNTFYNFLTEQLKNNSKENVIDIIKVINDFISILENEMESVVYLMANIEAMMEFETQKKDYDYTKLSKRKWGGINTDIIDVGSIKKLAEVQKNVYTKKYDEYIEKINIAINLIQLSETNEEKLEKRKDAIKVLNNIILNMIKDVSDKIGRKEIEELGSYYELIYMYIGLKNVLTEIVSNFKVFQIGKYSGVVKPTISSGFDLSKFIYDLFDNLKTLKNNSNVERDTIFREIIKEILDNNKITSYKNILILSTICTKLNNFYSEDIYKYFGDINNRIEKKYSRSSLKNALENIIKRILYSSIIFEDKEHFKKYIIDDQNIDDVNDVFISWLFDFYTVIKKNLSKLIESYSLKKYWLNLMLEETKKNINPKTFIYNVYNVCAPIVNIMWGKRLDDTSIENNFNKLTADNMGVIVDNLTYNKESFNLKTDKDIKSDIAKKFYNIYEKIKNNIKLLHKDSKGEAADFAKIYVRESIPDDNTSKTSSLLYSMANTKIVNFNFQKNFLNLIDDLFYMDENFINNITDSNENKLFFIINSTDMTNLNIIKNNGLIFGDLMKYVKLHEIHTFSPKEYHDKDYDKYDYHDHYNDEPGFVEYISGIPKDILRKAPIAGGKYSGIPQHTEF